MDDPPHMSISGNNYYPTTIITGLGTNIPNAGKSGPGKKRFKS